MLVTDVLFVCVRNASRSQIAKAFFLHFARQQGLSFRADSAGTQPARCVNPKVVEVMEELGIDLSGEQPKQLTNEMVEGAGRIITMGCAVDSDACPAMVLKDVEDWGIPDPRGKRLEEVRAIRDVIRSKVEQLLVSMKPRRV